MKLDIFSESYTSPEYQDSISLIKHSYTKLEQRLIDLHASHKEEISLKESFYRDMISSKTELDSFVLQEKYGKLPSAEVSDIDLIDESVMDTIHQTTDLSLLEHVGPVYETNVSRFEAALDDAIIRQSINFENAMFVIYRDRIAQEAMLLSAGFNNTKVMQELSSLNERVVDKIKKAWHTSIEAIKKIFATFMEKLRGNFSTTKHYMDQYKKVILNQKWVERDYSDTRQIIEAIGKLQTFEVPALNFDEASALAGGGEVDLAKIANKVPGMWVKPNSTIQDIATAAKNYLFGNENVTYKASDMQKNIDTIWNFMYDIRKIENNINKSIRKIEDSCNMAMKKAGVDIKAEDQPAQATAESYSALYGKVFAEVDAGPAGGDQPTAAPANGSAAAMRNAPEQKDDGYRNTGKPIVDTYCKAYSDVCVAMLKAKLTAVEFCRSEFMKIIRTHVNDYVKGQTTVRQKEVQQTQQEPVRQPGKTNERPTFKQRVKNAANAMRG